ncbi:MAG: hypothetical protein ACM3PP_08280 [Candidatus Saccharibacteria bacterium]
MQNDTDHQQSEYVVIYHGISARHNTDEALECLIEVIKHAQEIQPGCRRILQITINGHRKEDGSFTEMMTDFQLRIVPQKIVPYISEVAMPLGTFRNDKQLNDFPDHI